MGYFADSGPANTAEATPAQEALTEQIRAVLCTLAEGQTPSPREAIKGFQFDPDDTHEASMERQVKHLIQALAPDRECSAHQKLLKRAARDLARAADGDRLMKSKVEKHTRQQAKNHYPGAHREASRGISLGAGVGLPGIGEANLTGSALRGKSTSTYDDLAVAHFNTTTVTGRAAIEAGLPADVGAGAHASAHVTRGTGNVDDKMQDRVLALARASVERRLAGPRLLRIAKRVVGPRRDRYAERISTALAWQTRLPMLLGHSTPLRTPRFHPAPPVPIAATLHAVGGELGAHAGVAVLDAGVSAAATRTEVLISLPLRLTDTSAEASALRQDIMVQRRLDERLTQLLGRKPRTRSRSLHQVQCIRSSPADTGVIGLRLDAVEHLRAEFDHFEALARHALQAPCLAAAPLTSLSRDWGGDGQHREPVMVHMLDTLAWLQAAPRPAPGDPAQAAWDALQERVQQLADRIHASRIPHDRQQVHQATHAFRPMTQRIASRQGTVALTSSLGIPGLDAGARATVARLERDDPDPLRAGTYIDITLTGELTPALGELLAQVQRSLPGSEDRLPTEQIERVLTHLSPSFPSTLNARCVVRLFRPRFQREPGFPTWAKGLHLQTVRLSAGSSQGLNLVAPVPVAPGVSVSPGVHYQHVEQVPQMEWLLDGTLTGPLLRYISLRTPDTDETATWATMLERHGPDVDRLGRALSIPGSVPASEARYWLNRDIGHDGPTKAQREALALLTGLQRNPDPQMRRAQVHRLFAALAEATQRAKRASPFIGPAALPPSPLR
ncbi:hypothetical protein [Stenotrophomonas sp.]|uniref:hypothetical protein n=1 Tax=Stenotrophomonas sp. TaxID=69392 RepID=UPI0028ADF154|nr:hypothetical protein [Stenotrophomonas sp.]